jgi:hypothetical protein
MRKSSHLNAWPVDSIESPDEGQYLGELGYPVNFAALEYSGECTPSAERPGSVKPDHQSSARQSDIESREGKVTIADPPIPRVRLPYQGSKRGNIFLSLMRFPDSV